jgi:hypothetical protein
VIERHLPGCVLRLDEGRKKGKDMFKRDKSADNLHDAIKAELQRFETEERQLLREQRKAEIEYLPLSLSSKTRLKEMI